MRCTSFSARGVGYVPRVSLARIFGPFRLLLLLCVGHAGCATASRAPDAPEARPPSRSASAAPSTSTRPTSTEKPRLPDTGGPCLPERDGWALADQWAAFRRHRLEALVSQRGWVLLPPVQSTYGRPSDPDALLVGMSGGGCDHEVSGDYALDAEHRVHLLRPEYVSKRRVASKVCGCGRYRCGGEALPRTTRFVRAPHGAVLAEAVSITVPLDEDASFESEGGPCPPLP